MNKNPTRTDFQGHTSCSVCKHFARTGLKLVFKVTIVLFNEWKPVKNWFSRSCIALLGECEVKNWFPKPYAVLFNEQKPSSRTDF